MIRPRACAAVLNDDKILMVCHKTPSRTYWTLPGGGWQVGESLEQTAIREVKEETGLDVQVVKLLFEEEHLYGKSYCFLAELIHDATQPTLDFLPREEAVSGTMLHSAQWHFIRDKKDDIQVSKVITALRLDITDNL